MPTNLTPNTSHLGLNHIAIIMDGNGRWAQKRGLPRVAGHKMGIEATKKVVQNAIELDVSCLTLFGFSTENWKRPAEEVNELMRLLKLYLRAETATLHKNNIRVRMIGFREDLPQDVVELIEHAEDLTAENTGLNLSIALNYGGRQDILQAVAKAVKSSQAEDIKEDDLSAEVFESFLLTKDLPEPDLLIRTSGEKRISNFLLWQCAYTELYFSETLWPDFSKEDLKQAIVEYQNRDRRFGSVKSL